MSSVDNGSPFQAVISVSFLFEMCPPISLPCTSPMDLNDHIRSNGPEMVNSGIFVVHKGGGSSEGFYLFVLFLLPWMFHAIARIYFIL